MKRSSKLAERNDSSLGKSADGDFKNTDSSVKKERQTDDKVRERNS